jgi:FtsZ-interacting cell division protein ZipA
MIWTQKKKKFNFFKKNNIEKTKNRKYRKNRKIENIEKIEKYRFFFQICITPQKQFQAVSGIFKNFGY